MQGRGDNTHPSRATHHPDLDGTPLSCGLGLLAGVVVGGLLVVL
jgi:hypothetical protein